MAEVGHVLLRNAWTCACSCTLPLKHTQAGELDNSTVNAPSDHFADKGNLGMALGEDTFTFEKLLSNFRETGGNKLAPHGGVPFRYDMFGSDSDNAHVSCERLLAAALALKACYFHLPPCISCTRATSARSSQ